MKELDSSILELISGAGDKATNGQGGNKGGGAPSSCANQVGVGIIIGAATGIPGGPAGVLGLGVAGGMSAALGCPSKSPYNNGGNGTKNNSNGPHRQ
jgi:hypothetical protein